MRATFRSTTRAFTSPASRLAALGLIAALAAAPILADTNRIVLRVNDRISTLRDYEDARRQLIETLRRSDLPPEQLQERLADVGVEVMSDLFEEMLLLSRGDQIDAVPSRQDLDDALVRSKENAGIESQEDFIQALAGSGFTLESFRKHLNKTLMMNSVMGREVRPRIRLTEEDLRRYYQAHLEDYRLPVRVKVREFVVLEAATTVEQDRVAIAEDIRERLRAGEDPDEVLAEYTEKGLTTPWIEVGWVSSGDLDPALEAAVWDLEVGQLSPAVAARGGMHLCEVLDRQEATIQEFAAVAEEIEELESNRRFKTEIGEYMAELERSSYVVISPPPEAASFRSVLERRREEGLEFNERETALAGAGLDLVEPAPEPEPEEPPSDESG